LRRRPQNKRYYARLNFAVNQRQHRGLILLFPRQRRFKAMLGAFTPHPGNRGAGHAMLCGNFSGCHAGCVVGPFVGEEQDVSVQHLQMVSMPPYFFDVLYFVICEKNMAFVVWQIIVSLHARLQ
jgi:hypothetical protein